MAGTLTAELVLRVRRRVGDLAGVTWSDSTIRGYLSEAQTRLAASLHPGVLHDLSKVAGATLTAALADYALPSDFLRERLVLYKTLTAKRTPAEEYPLKTTGGLAGQSETKPHYWLWGGYLKFLVGTVTQTNGDTYELWYILDPPALSASVDPVVARPLYGLLEEYAVGRCLEENGQPRVAAMILQRFEDLCRIINARCSGNVIHDGPLTDRRP